MRVEKSVTAVTWIPSEAIEGMPKLPFELGMTSYDDPPPDRLGSGQLELLRDENGFREANELRAWIEVDEGKIVDSGYSGGAHIGTTHVKVGPKTLSFPGVGYPLLQTEPEVGPDWVKFVQSAGGRMGLPAPRRVSGKPYFQVASASAWTTLQLIIYADGTSKHRLIGASPFPRHWIYDDGGPSSTRAARSTSSAGGASRSARTRRGAGTTRRHSSPPWSRSSSASCPGSSWPTRSAAAAQAGQGRDARRAGRAGHEHVPDPRRDARRGGGRRDRRRGRAGRDRRRARLDRGRHANLDAAGGDERPRGRDSGELARHGRDRGPRVDAPAGDVVARVALVTGAGTGIGGRSPSGSRPTGSPSGSRLTGGETRNGRSTKSWRARAGALGRRRPGGSGRAFAAGREVAEHFGRLDVLVNNAGITVSKPALELTANDFDAIFAVDVRAAFLAAQAAARTMGERGGVIVNVTSVHEHVPRPGFALYAPAKAALGMLTRSLALELAPSIRVVSVAPGAIDVERNEADAERLRPEIPLSGPAARRRSPRWSRGSCRKRRSTRRARASCWTAAWPSRSSRASQSAEERALPVPPLQPQREGSTTRVTRESLKVVRLSANDGRRLGASQVGRERDPVPHRDLGLRVLEDVPDERVPLEHRVALQGRQVVAPHALGEPLELEVRGFPQPAGRHEPDCQPVARPSSRTRNQSSMSIRGFRLAIVYASCM